MTCSNYLFFLVVVNTRGEWTDHDDSISDLLHVTTPPSDDCFSLWTVLSVSSIVLPYVTFALKLLLITGCIESYHHQLSGGKLSWPIYKVGSA